VTKYLCIDAGNTRSKAAVYAATGELQDFAYFNEDQGHLLMDWCNHQQANFAILCTTGDRRWTLEDVKVSGTKMELSHELVLPIKLVYNTPETLGRDRIAAACGARYMFPDRNCLVISAGTCMTTDIVLKSGTYLGGNIAPGLRMRLQAMHQFTAKLPLAEPAWNDKSFGDSTIHALQNGACLGMRMEIDGIFQRARDAFGTVLIVMTGGDAAFLAEQAENQIFVAPDLVTQGLFQILALNV
jgi:type III pantothenate kinase